MARLRSAPLTLLVLLACSPPVPKGEAEVSEPDCAADSDCAFGERCVDGACVVRPNERPSECATSDDCLGAPLDSIPDLYFDGAGKVCSLDPEDCDDEGCAGRRVCAADLAGASRPGAVACTEDAQCLSGHCVSAGADRVCLKTCGGDGDCAGEEHDGVRRGDRCGSVSIGESGLRACVPAVEGRPLCRSDCDCSADGACDGARSCRFLGEGPLLPGCEPRPVEPLRATGERCELDASCAGNACLDGCDSGPAFGARHFCAESQNRCTAPCGDDDDCPTRLRCGEGPSAARIGAWQLAQQKPNEVGRDVRYCQLPLFGCFDAQDCFPYVDGNGQTVESWQLDEPLCKLSVLRPTTSPRVVSLCQPRDPALAPPGACCDAHEACDTGLCVPAPPGAGCAAGFCSVPCDPSTDPDGLPASGDEKDRCPELPTAPTWFPASFGATRCQPFLWERTLPDEQGVPRAWSDTVQVCR